MFIEKDAIQTRVGIYTYVVTRVGKNTGGKMVQRENIVRDANRVVRYNAKSHLGGGFDLKHKPCSYGLILKYNLFCKGLSYKRAGELLGGITPQAVNHLLNRMPKERFFEDDITRYCKVFKINEEYFLELSKEVDKLLEVKYADTI